ncbi:hypothetical protein QBC37DRAFT_433077 [Rhypophila decipiens]|uniref:FAD-binding domain-containing protein n=1 Tax=Rhypophila decipiens TaxID=261697 RepID=A0AAN6XXU8_9PEZI|nr:hypothetical protein QBC37DRAFT_433077 [Rhypophila decipiens]
MHVIIIGAGPAGLAAALALHKQQQSESKFNRSSESLAPFCITILELRPNIETGTQLGGAINLTPLALRYLDALGVGEKLRPLGCKVSGIDFLSHRSGVSLGKMWPDFDSLRVARHDVVESMARKVLETSEQSEAGRVSIRYGVKVTKIEESGSAGSSEGCVKVSYFQNGEPDGKILEGDVLLGCDGIHSFVRSTYVDPAREKRYSGRGGAYSYVTVDKPGDAGVLLRDGQPAVKDSSMTMGPKGSLLTTFCEPSKTKLYIAAVLNDTAEVWKDQASKDGRRATGAETEILKQDLLNRFSGSELVGLDELVAKCEEWFFFPVFMLPPGGIWSRGRILLLGDAAHAMPPMGESTGVAIEDAVLLAHVLSRRGERSVKKLFDDYEGLRRDVIAQTYKETVALWGDASEWSSFKSVMIDWLMWVIVLFINRGGKSTFARDVRLLSLPA